MALSLNEINELVAKESSFVDAIIQESGKVIVGQEYVLNRLLIGVLVGGHILLEGVPGLAKTLAISTLSQAIDADFKRIQFTPDLLPADLQLPVVTIPSNNATIPATTPGTILNVVVPEVTVAPIGTTPPPSIPLNSLTPTVFNQPPTTVEIPTISNTGSLNTSSCF